jgi:hypothetical protein
MRQVQAATQGLTRVLSVPAILLEGMLCVQKKKVHVYKKVVT